MTSPLGSGRRCHLARAAAALASSLDFLQGTSEKIHLQGLLCQKLLQAMDFLAVSRCVRAGPRRFLSWFNHLQLSAPLVEAPRSYPEFSCQLTDIFASLHAFDSPLLKFPGVSLSLHCGSFPGNCALFLCVSSRVHSSLSIINPMSTWFVGRSIPDLLRSPSQRASDLRLTARDRGARISGQGEAHSPSGRAG